MRAGLRPSWIALMLIALGSQTVCSQAPVVTAQQDESRLTGCDLKAEDLILRADAIIVAKLVKMGTETTSGSQFTMHENQAQEIQFLRGGTQSPMEIDIPLDLAKGEKAPVAGTPYIFFLEKNQTRPAAWAMDPYDAIKLLDATDTNMTEVKRLINLPANMHELPGSRVKLPDAAKADTVFVGTILDISPYGDTDAAGGSHYWPKIAVTRVLRGWIDNPLSVQIFVTYNPHEQPPVKGSSYIFFIDKIPGWNLGRKLMHATDETIRQVTAGLPVEAANNEFFCGDGLDAETALTKSDAIFVGEITAQGMEDHGDSFSFAYPAFHFCAVNVKVAQVLRGTVPDKTSVTLFEKPPSPSDQGVFKDPYIFFVKNNEAGSRDPFTVLKVLRSSDVTIAQTKQQILPTPDYVYGTSLNLADAIAKSETIYIGAITELGGGQGSHVTVFDTLRGSPPRQATVDLNMDSPPREGCSYIFIGTKNTNYEGDTVNVLQLLAATDANVKKVKEIISKVP